MIALSGAPMKAMRPSTSRISSWNWLKSSELGWWMVQTMVLPWAAMLLIMWTIFWAENESRPVVGSSQKSSVGSVSSSEANASRFFSPPDNTFSCPMAPMRVSDLSARPSVLSRSATCRRRSIRLVRLSSRIHAWGRSGCTIMEYSESDSRRLTGSRMHPILTCSCCVYWPFFYFWMVA